MKKVIQTVSYLKFKNNYIIYVNHSLSVQFITGNATNDI